MADTKTVFLALLLATSVVAADPVGPEIGKVTSPSVSDVASYLNTADARLERLGCLVRCEAAHDEIDEALAEYTREFSRFHVNLGRLPAREREPYFLNKLPAVLDDHLAKLRSVTEKVQRSQRIAANEAMSHVKGALDMARELARKRGLAEKMRFQPILPEAPAPLDPTARIPGPAQRNSNSSRWR